MEEEGRGEDNNWSTSRSHAEHHGPLGGKRRLRGCIRLTGVGNRGRGGGLLMRRSREALVRRGAGGWPSRVPTNWAEGGTPQLGHVSKGCRGGPGRQRGERAVGATRSLSTSDWVGRGHASDGGWVFASTALQRGAVHTGSGTPHGDCRKGGAQRRFWRCMSAAACT